MLSIRRLIAFTTFACAALVLLLLSGNPVAAGVAKMLASAGFVTIALRAGALESLPGRLVLLGLLLSWCGDALLIGTSQAAFLLGLAAFLLAHLAYVAAFIARGISLRWLVLTALPVALIALAASWWLTPHIAPSLEAPVRLYTVVISVMVVCAAGTHGRQASVYFLVGALLFFLSDLSVAALRIVQTDVPVYVLGLPLYYGGQVLLALGTSQSRSH